MDNENNPIFIPVGFFGVGEPMAFLFTGGLYENHINLCWGDSITPLERPMKGEGSTEDGA